MEPAATEVVPKRGPSSPKIIVDTNLTVQNSSAIRPTPVKPGKTITHLAENNKQVQVCHVSAKVVLSPFFKCAKMIHFDAASIKVGVAQWDQMHWLLHFGLTVITTCGNR